MSKYHTTIRIKIDVKKINKDRLYVGKKGTYLEATVMLSDDEDQYGNSGIVLESVSKAERESGVEATILGNVTGVWSRGAGQSQPAKPAKEVKVVSDDDDDDLPF